MIHKCNNCEYQSPYKGNYMRHIANKHGIKQPHVDSTPSQAGSGAVQSVQPHSEDHSNLQEESVDQLYENIDQWQKAYETLKLQYQQEEKVTTCDDGMFYPLLDRVKMGLKPLVPFLHIEKFVVVVGGGWVGAMYRKHLAN